MRPNAFPMFGLRLLDASGCTNATSTGLAEALPHFPGLVSLDLSRTAAARDKAVFSAFKFLRNLRVLNLRGLGLRDIDFSVIAESIRSRVRSLDISENHLTDSSARLLLDCCLKETIIEARTSRGPLAPFEYRQSDSDVDVFETENLVSYLRKKLTEGFVGSLAVEEARDVGITHLYISRNAITVEGISGLLRSKRLQVLDMGNMPAVIKNPSFTSLGAAEADIELPSVSKLTPVLAVYATTSLKCLRINYRIITEDATLEAAAPPRAELDGNLDKYAPSNAHELEAIKPSTPELESEPTAIVELPGDSLYPVELLGSLNSFQHPSTNADDVGNQESNATQSSTTSITSHSPNTKRGSVYAPEVVPVDSPMSPSSISGRNNKNYKPSSARDTEDMRASLSPLTLSPDGHVLQKSATPFVPRSRAHSFYYIEDQRARLDFRQGQENRLHPGMVSKLHTLILTDVPVATADKELIRRLIQYLKDAAEESSIARQRARHTYMLPPGRSRMVAEREYASGLFALRRIVLEMAPPQAAPKKTTTSWRAYPTKSSTEDADSEAFWDAAAQDFSFFDDEECGQPGRESDRTLPLAVMSGLELAPSSSIALPKPYQTTTGERPLLDVVGEIGEFRRERKAAYTNLVQMGEVDPEVEGYWPGDITIFRKPANPKAGEIDWYGNRYESGWYYR
jgi:hypothetical protein